MERVVINVDAIKQRISRFEQLAQQATTSGDRDKAWRLKNQIETYRRVLRLLDELKKAGLAQQFDQSSIPLRSLSNAKSTSFRQKPERKKTHLRRRRKTTIRISSLILGERLQVMEAALFGEYRSYQELGSVFWPNELESKGLKYVAGKASQLIQQGFWRMSRVLENGEKGLARLDLPEIEKAFYQRVLQEYGPDAIKVISRGLGIRDLDGKRKSSDSLRRLREDIASGKGLKVGDRISIASQKGEEPPPW
ncbi:MAG: hypothetical protein A2172_04860 [Candidatus Woykebacteria bacterium RBG_13_40_15]|uniref:Uncharacterized protein n=1 Tax=Candidatus Woykebacteria bacterium RBG_13_40_15 TaxID=1802593 RepID=A0A1G1W7G2_9BACT|nr:MAG: hypothetical protein A2172_04860 [Candidatus Woykebacteria bacterium RBG_13_40_15]